jgi:hypothetical protein
MFAPSCYYYSFFYRNRWKHGHNCFPIFPNDYFLMTNDSCIDGNKDATPSRLDENTHAGGKTIPGGKEHHPSATITYNMYQR